MGWKKWLLNGIWIVIVILFFILLEKNYLFSSSYLLTNKLVFIIPPILTLTLPFILETIYRQESKGKGLIIGSTISMIISYIVPRYFYVGDLGFGGLIFFFYIAIGAIIFIIGTIIWILNRTKKGTTIPQTNQQLNNKPAETDLSVKMPILIFSIILIIFLIAILSGEFRIPVFVTLTIIAAIIGSIFYFINKRSKENNPQIQQSNFPIKKAIIGIVIFLVLVFGGLILYSELSYQEDIENTFPREESPICEEILDIKEKITCYYNLAKENKDPAFCNHILLGTNNICYETVARETLNHTICEYIQNPESQGSCYDIVAIKLLDPTICDKIQVENTKTNCHSIIETETSSQTTQPSNSTNKSTTTTSENSTNSGQTTNNAQNSNTQTETKNTTNQDLQTTESHSTRLIQDNRVTLAITPPSNSSVYAVEEELPVGVTAINFTEGGVWDVTKNKAKWGPWFDNQERTLTYTVSGPEGAYTISGVTSIDGKSYSTSGQNQIVI